MIFELSLFLSVWVRARNIAVYLTVFLGTQAVAAPIWAMVTDQTPVSSSNPRYHIRVVLRHSTGAGIRKRGVERSLATLFHKV
jgi:hypothetical protein